MDTPLIIVINHERVFLDLMHEILSEEGYAVLCWHAEDAPFARLQEAQPRLAIIDINMRYRDAAWAFLERIHNDPTTAHIPVIVCTADIIYVREKAPHLLRFNYTVIEKPFNIEDMLQRVQEMLSPNGVAPLPRRDNRQIPAAA
jgi:CheY-like chemotaxis protein